VNSAHPSISQPDLRSQIHLSQRWQGPLLQPSKRESNSLQATLFIFLPAAAGARFIPARLWRGGIPDRCKACRKLRRRSNRRFQWGVSRKAIRSRLQRLKAIPPPKLSYRIFYQPVMGFPCKAGECFILSLRQIVTHIFDCNAALIDQAVCKCQLDFCNQFSRPKIAAAVGKLVPDV